MRLVRVGIVSSVHPDRGTVRVQLPDVHGDGTAFVSRELHVGFDKTCKDKQYHMPDVGEHVFCLFMPTGQEQGCVLRAFYSEADTVPVADPDKRHIAFQDGSWFEYDRKKHHLSGHVVNGSAKLEIDKDCTVNVGGDATVSVVGDLLAEAEGEATMRSDVLARVQAPQIQMLGNMSSSALGGGLATEIKLANVDHTGDVDQVGDVRQTGDYELVGTLHVTRLIVDDPIDGSFEGGGD